VFNDLKCRLRVIDGCERKDVLYLALTRKSCGATTLYFTFLCSQKLFAIETQYLKDGIASGKIQGKNFRSQKRFKVKILIILSQTLEQNLINLS
jgi:hypothetical protein